MKSQYIEDYGWLENEYRKVRIGKMVRNIWKDRFNNIYIVVKGKPIRIGYFDGSHAISDDDIEYEGIELIDWRETI